MNMQQMVQAMQKMQRQYEKEHKILEETEFSYTANGAVEIVIKGDMELVSIKILDKSLLNEDDSDMLEDMIKIAYDHVRDEILAKEDELAEKFKNVGGFGF